MARDGSAQRRLRFFAQPLMTRGILSATLLLAFLVWAGPVVGDKHQGVLELRIKDHREAIGDFSKLTVTIEQILVSPKRGIKFWQTGWKSLTSAPQSINLTKHTGKNSAQVFRSTLATGSFDAVHVKLGSIDGVLKRSQSKAVVKNLLGPLELDFDVRPQAETLIVLDLMVLDMSDHPSRGYELAIRGYELYTNGKLIDKIPPGS
jgi:hypothetical protein